MAEKRFDEIDIMRIFGFLMVVDQHILGSYAQRPEASFGDSMILNFLYLLGRPAVPMFVAITGFTLFNANYSNFNIKKFYRKRLGTIVVPYLFWSFATILLFHKYEILEDIVWRLLTGTASYHLWYMGMTIRLYLWFPIILAGAVWLRNRNRGVQGFTVAILSLLYWILLKNNNIFIDGVSKFIFGNPTQLEKLFVQYTPLLWSIYFIWGAFSWFNYEDFKNFASRHKGKIILLHIPLTLYMYYAQICSSLPEGFRRINSEHAIYILYMINTILVIYIISLRIREKADSYIKLLSELGSLSYGAYLVHVIVLNYAAEIVSTWMPVKSYLISGLIIFIWTSWVSFGICHVIRHMPLSKYVIGVRTAPLLNKYDK